MTLSRVEHEPLIKTGGNLWKPDLIAIDEERNCHVIDAQVVGLYRSLKTLHEHKADKYNTSGITEAIKLKYDVVSVKYTSLTITYHGLMAKESARDMRALRITRPMLISLVGCVLDGSARMWNVFRTSTRRSIVSKTGSTRPSSLPTA